MKLDAVTTQNAYLMLLCQQCASLMGWRCSDVAARGVEEQKYICLNCAKEYTK